MDSNWRTEVINRDNTCQCCGDNYKLEAHHIFPYKTFESLHNEVNNGIALCHFCHKKYHHHYGLNRDVNPVTLTEFIRKFGVRF